jgi:hypothetical protein
LLQRRTHGLLFGIDSLGSPGDLILVSRDEQLHRPSCGRAAGGVDRGESVCLGPSIAEDLSTNVSHTMQARNPYCHYRRRQKQYNAEAETDARSDLQIFK